MLPPTFDTKCPLQSRLQLLAPTLVSPSDDAQEALSEFLLLQLTAHENDELIQAAFSLVRRHGIALYDGLYVALSQELHLPFLTADRRLYDRIRVLPAMLWLAAYTQ
jgi:predicted nucleic acid-binding protein